MDIGPLLKWKEDGVERPGWSHESSSFNALWAQWDFLRVENGLLKRAWESPDGKHTTIRIEEELREIHGGSGAQNIFYN